MAKLKNVLGFNNFEFPAAGVLDKTGYKEWGLGGTTTQQGLDSLDALDSQYQDQIAGGGLTPALQRVFQVGRGAIADNATRSRRSLAADILQKRIASGGDLSASAALEYQMQGQQGIDESTFSANNALTADEAQQSLSATQALQNSILAIRKNKTDVGQSEKDRAASIIMNAAALKLQRRKETSQELRGWFGTVFGGGK